MFHRRAKKKHSRRPSLPFERRLLLSVLAIGVPGALLAFLLLWTNSYSLDHQIEGTCLVAILWLTLSFSARNRVVNSIRLLSSVIASLEEDDFSLRASEAVQGDALGELVIEINNLARALEAERLGAMEAESLLQKVLAEADGVILAFSTDGKLKLFNRAAAAFLGNPKANLSNQRALDLGVSDLLEGPSSNTISRFEHGIERRWIVRRTQFRQSGVPHQLVMLSEVSETLRAEERMAWQRMVRVLSHEINNSLGPIRSVARTLNRILSTTELPERVRKDCNLGLNLIADRVESLNRFLQSYAQLNKLPPPERHATELKNLFDRVIGLEARLSVALIPGADVTVNVDPEQLEQVLINLIKNAVEAVLARDPGDGQSLTKDGRAVTATWQVTGKDLQLWIRDRGIGLLDTANIFVPFYTTKESGTGIGLVLSRQIVENHGGRLMIRNRTDISGCEVEVKIPGCVTSASAPRGAGEFRSYEN